MLLKMARLDDAAIAALYSVTCVARGGRNDTSAAQHFDKITGTSPVSK